MRCPLSQNCTTRWSETRLCTMPLGCIQSVGSIGSHTTRTRTDIEGLCSKMSSIAEDPRKQYAQVGDRSRTSRVRSAESLNTRRKVSRLSGVRDVSGDRAPVKVQGSSARSFQQAPCVGQSRIGLNRQRVAVGGCRGVDGALIDDDQVVVADVATGSRDRLGDGELVSGGGGKNVILAVIRERDRTAPCSMAVAVFTCSSVRLPLEFNASVPVLFRVPFM